MTKTGTDRGGQDAPTVATRGVSAASSSTPTTLGTAAGTGATSSAALDSARTLPSAVQEVLAVKGPSLGTKFFVAAAALVVATLLAAVAFATWRANQIADRTIRAALTEIPKSFEAYRSSVESRLKGSLRSISEESGTKGIVETTLGTIHEFAGDKAKALGTKTVFVFNREGILLARNDKEPETEPTKSFRGAAWVAAPIESWSDATANIREGPSLALVASVPIIAGDKAANEARLVGVLATAMPYGLEQAKALKGLTGGQVAFVANVAKRGAAPELAFSAATEQFGGDAILSQLRRDEASTRALFEEGRDVGPLTLTALGDTRIVAGLPIKNAAGETLGALVVSRSLREETAAFREIRAALLLIGLLSLVVSIPVAYAMGRRIARPLQELARGAAAIRHGTLDVRLPEGGSDEVGALARAFVAMVGELREKAQLEEMLAEMQRRPGDVTRAGATTATLVPGARGGPRVGELFANRYDVLSTLGRGGMGSVYRALDRELEDEVALKVLTPEAFDEGTLAVQTLKQEIRLARKITHANVVRTHDLGEADGVRFLTMEYVPGTTLREVVDRRGAVAIAVGLQIAKQLCRGLGAVHDAGIIHRDIKPQNIMVLPNGVVKLMDFGIARTTEGADPSAQEGQTVGTPYYMSPEQARGATLDARSDLYSVAVVLFELFTAARPFEGKDPMEVMKKHVMAEPTRPRQLRPDLPEALEKILLACLAKDPNRRPSSAGDLYGALMSIGAGTARIAAL